MGRHQSGGGSQNEADHYRQSENASSPPRQYRVASYQESQTGESPSDQPYPSDAVAFSREGLQSVDIALLNVRMALANARARRDVASRSRPDNSVKIKAEVPVSSKSAYGPNHSMSGRHTTSYLSSSRPVPRIPPHGASTQATPAFLGKHAVVDRGSKQEAALELNIDSNTENIPRNKRRASQAFLGDATSVGRAPKVQRTDKNNVVVSHEESRALSGVATTNVNIDGTSLPLVFAPCVALGTGSKDRGDEDAKFIRIAVTCLKRLPGFTFTHYSTMGLQAVAPLFDALIRRNPVTMRRMYQALYNFLPMIFRQLLSQRELYTDVTDHAMKTAFFSHIHRVHYSALVLKHSCHRDPRSRANHNPEAELWAQLDVDVLVKVIEAVVSAREAFLQDLVAKRSVAATTEAGLYPQDDQDIDPNHSSMEIRSRVGIKTEMEAPRMVKQELVPASLDTNNMGFKPELGGLEDVCLDDIPKYKDGDGDDEWLNDLKSDDEGSLQRPPLPSRPRKGRRLYWNEMGERRTRIAVDRWIRFVRVELGRS